MCALTWRMFCSRISQIHFGHHGTSDNLKDNFTKKCTFTHLVLFRAAAMEEEELITSIRASMQVFLT